jgi:hypothetical protein
MREIVAHKSLSTILIDIDLRDIHIRPTMLRETIRITNRIKKTWLLLMFVAVNIISSQP